VEAGRRMIPFNSARRAAYRSTTALRISYCAILLFPAIRPSPPRTRKRPTTASTPKLQPQPSTLPAPPPRKPTRQASPPTSRVGTVPSGIGDQRTAASSGSITAHYDSAVILAL
jgi:hypothetical protein